MLSTLSSWEPRFVQIPSTCELVGSGVMAVRVKEKGGEEGKGRREAWGERDHPSADRPQAQFLNYISQQA